MNFGRCYFCGQKRNKIRLKKKPTKIKMTVTDIVEEIIGTERILGGKIKKLRRVYTKIKEEIIEEQLACPNCFHKTHSIERVVEFGIRARDREETKVSSFLFRAK